MSYATYKNVGVDKDAPHPNDVINVHEISSVDERNYYIANNNLVVIDYFTNWCGPCKMVAPKFAQLAKKYTNQGIVFVKENAENKLGEYGSQIRGVPCFHFYVRGQHLPKYTITGASIPDVEKNIIQILETF